MVSTVWINADHGRDFHPLADHTTQLKNFTKEENLDFSAFRFSHQLMVEQALTNLIVYDFTKTTYKTFTNELECCSG